LAFLRQTLETLGVCGHGPDVFLEDDLRRRGGTDDRAEPPQVGWAPGRSTCLPEILPQEKGFEPNLRGFVSAESLCTCAAQVPHRFIVSLRDVDRGQGPRTHQAGQCEGVSPVGFDPIPGLFGTQGGCDAPADMAVCGEITLEAVPTGACLIDKEEMLAFRLHLPDELIDVTLSCPDGAEGDDLGTVVLNDISDGH
jgi:hypothetical protein